MTRAATAILLLLLGAAPAAAQADARSQAIDMASVMAAHDLCGFDLTDAQADALAKRRQALIDDGGLTSAEFETIETEMTASMKRQIPEGLCKPDGAQARLYRQQIGAVAGD